MKINETILDKITPQGRIRLALALEVTEQAVIKAIKKNAPHGPLTRYAALQVLADITGKDMPELVTGTPKMTASA